MKFLLEVDLSGTASSEEAAGELGRILRYWGGNVRHYDLMKPGVSEGIYDSNYQDVGRWSIVETSDT